MKKVKITLLATILLATASQSFGMLETIKNFLGMKNRALVKEFESIFKKMETLQKDKCHHNTTRTICTEQGKYQVKHKGNARLHNWYELEKDDETYEITFGNDPDPYSSRNEYFREVKGPGFYYKHNLHNGEKKYKEL